MRATTLKPQLQFIAIKKHTQRRTNKWENIEIKKKDQ